MTIFQLALVVCQTMGDLSGLPPQTQCRWMASSFYADRGKCEASGLARLGERVFSDSMVIGSDGERIKSHVCRDISVVE